MTRTANAVGLATAILSMLAVAANGYTTSDGQTFSGAQSTFMTSCTTSMLSDEKKADGTITQQEFATEFVNYCNTFTKPALPGHQCPPPNFPALPTQVQLAFSQGVCPKSAGEQERMQCLNGLITLNNFGAAFGYIVGSENLEEQIEMLCVDLSPFVLLAETPAPTSRPSTSSPTPAPTKDPVVAADGSITSSPTNVPTIAPAAAPNGSTTDGTGSTPNGSPADSPAGTPNDSPAGSPNTNPTSPTNPTNDSTNDSFVSPTDNTGTDSGSGTDSDSGTDGGTDTSNGDTGSSGSDTGGDDSGTDTPDTTGRTGDPTPAGDDGNSDSELISTRVGVVAVAGASMCLLCCCLAILWRRRSLNDGDGDEESLMNKKLGDIEEDISEADLRFLPGLDALVDTGDTSSTASSSSIPKFMSFGTNRFAANAHISTRDAVQSMMLAIDHADWNEVYNLSHVLAEREDLSTVSTAGRDQFNVDHSSSTARANLSKADKQRARTLDAFVAGADWTSIAVTSALYAGESGAANSSKAKNSGATGNGANNLFGLSQAHTASMTDCDDTASLDENRTLSTINSHADGSYENRYQNQQYQQSRGFAYPSSPTRQEFEGRSAVPGIERTRTLDSLRSELDDALEVGDWNRISSLSNEVEHNPEYQRGMTAAPVAPAGEADESLEVQMNRAVHLGDWALVSYYADRLKQKMDDGSMAAPSSTALVPAVRSSTARSGFDNSFLQMAPSTDTTDSAVSKQNAIQRLLHKGNFRGASIMAGLYDMESRIGTNSRSVVPSTSSNQWFRMLAMAREEERNSLGDLAGPGGNMMHRQEEEVRLREVEEGLSTPQHED